MSLAFEPADIGYVAYVDEAGDPGLNRVRPIIPGGASEWLSIGAILIRVERERDTVGWVQAIRQAVGSHQRRDLHFGGLGDAKKALVCETIASLPVRCFVLLSNKKNMMQYRNDRAASARPSGQEWFYNWCIRLILERITDFVERDSMLKHGKPKHVQMVFSERGGTRYGQMIAYHDLLKSQSRSNTTVLNKRTVKWQVLHPASYEIVAHSKNAGVQLADAVASSFYQAANTLSSSTWNPSHAQLLKSVVAIENGTHADYGVTLMPHWRKANLTQDQQQIFRFYGYTFK